MLEVFNCAVLIYNEQMINSVLNILNQPEPAKISEEKVFKQKFSLNIEGMAIAANPLVMLWKNKYNSSDKV